MTSSTPEYPQLDPSTYIELARELEARTEPAAKRAAADRAYYAAFLASRDELASKNYLTPYYYNVDDHKYVGQSLKRQDVLGQAGNDEMRLRLGRNRATYDTRDLLLSTQDVKKLSWMISTAEDIIQKVRALPPRP